MIEPTTVPANVWVKATWEEFLALADNPKRVSDRFYYDQGCLKIETPSYQGSAIFSTLIILYAMSRNILLKGLTRGSFRKVGTCEFQPDLAFYVGESLTFPPRSHLPVNLNESAPPTLVVEILDSCREDCDRKTTLYQQADIQEYWVVDVKASQVLAFTLSVNESVSIRVSQVLPGLEMAIVEEALKRSQTEDDGAIGRWLLALFGE